MVLSLLHEKLHMARSSALPGQGNPAPTSDGHCTPSPQMGLVFEPSGNVYLLEQAERALKRPGEVKQGAETCSH